MLLSAHLVAQRSDLITFYVTSLFLRYYKVSMFGMHQAQLLFQLSEIENQYFLLPVQNLILGLLQCRSPLQRMSLGSHSDVPRQARFLTICSGSCGTQPA